MAWQGEKEGSAVPCLNAVSSCLVFTVCRAWRPRRAHLPRSLDTSIYAPLLSDSRVEPPVPRLHGPRGEPGRRESLPAPPPPKGESTTLTHPPVSVREWVGGLVGGADSRVGWGRCASCREPVIEYSFSCNLVTSSYITHHIGSFLLSIINWAGITQIRVDISPLFWLDKVSLFAGLLNVPAVTHRNLCRVIFSNAEENRLDVDVDVESL